MRLVKLNVQNQSLHMMQLSFSQMLNGCNKIALLIAFFSHVSIFLNALSDRVMRSYSHPLSREKVLIILGKALACKEE